MTQEPLDVIWRPSPAQIQNSQLHAYMQWLREHKGLEFADYAALWQWSVDHLEDFWASVWDYFDILHSAPYTQVLDTQRMPGAHWFIGARLNLAEQVFRFNHGAAGSKPAILARSEVRNGMQEVSWDELRRQVASMAAALRKMGVTEGDRVVAYLPNIPETIVAFLACASVGAIWSVCSPDMGTRSVLDRFQQIEPKVLLAVDGYRYGGKDHDRLDVVRHLREHLPTLEQVVLLPLLDVSATLDGSLHFAELLAGDAEPVFAQLPFEHPLWIVYSSGTTGLPKPIVHGQGGVLLELTKHHALQMDLSAADRFFWLSTTGWVMWNLQVAGLFVGATACLYDGNPGHPDLGVVWRFAEETQTTVFGSGAAFYDACRKAGQQPKQLADLSRVRALGSTGSPLAPETAHWMVGNINAHAMIASASGGTDVATGYVSGCPMEPVVAGEIPARCLGIAVYAYSDDGRVLEDEVGELVVTRPMPSMPLYFWGDADGQRFHESYFDVYPGIWRHGDWIRITPRGSAVIYGRSDTTINRGGIRMGTGEIYRVVEEFDEIVDSMVVDLEYLGRESWMPLFVVMRPGEPLSDALVQKVKAAIREKLSPRHVPNEILPVAEIPRTLSGKKLELPVRKLLLGMPLKNVVSPDSMSNPQSLDYFVELARKRNHDA